MTAKIKELKSGMINVQIEGIKKSELKTGLKGEHFHFFIFDNEGESIRIVAFKKAAEKWFNRIKNNESYQISKASVEDNTYNEVTSNQIILTTDVSIFGITLISLKILRQKH